MNPHIDMLQDERFMALHRLVKPYTITSIERQYALYQAVLHIERNKIPGLIVECGVWKGGSMLLAAKLLAELGSTNREFLLFDTFSGMTPHGEHDVPIEGIGAAHFEGDTLAVPIPEVAKVLLLSGYPFHKFYFMAGDVSDAARRWDFEHLEERYSSIALLRLDTDWYESTRAELLHFYPHVQPGGVVLIDDYGHWLGQKKAVDEYFKSENYPPLLHRIDYSGRMFVKD